MLMKKPSGRVFNPSDPIGYAGGAKQPVKQQVGLLGDITSAFKSQFPGVSKKIGELKGGVEDMFEGTDKEAMAMMAMSSQPSKDFNAVHFPVTSVVSALTADGVTGESALLTTLPAGTTLFMRITAITLTSGIGIGYSEHDGNANA